MKNSRVQKLMLLLAIVMYSCLAKGQDSIDYTLNNIKRYASRMDESFSALSNRAGDERKSRMQAAERMRVFCDSIDEEMEYLPDDYYFRLSPLVSAYRADIDEYEKLVLNDDFEGRETCLSAAFSSLQKRQASFRRAVASAYENAVSPSPGKWVTYAEEQDAPVPADDPAGNGNSAVRDNNDPADSRTENTGENGASKNVVLLDTIHMAMQQIEVAIHLTERAIAKNDVGAIRLNTSRIADASLTISGLSLLLDAKGKENLYMLAASLRHAAENLRGRAKKNTIARSGLADGISEIKIKFSSLSTGISFVK